MMTAIRFGGQVGELNNNMLFESSVIRPNLASTTINGVCKLEETKFNYCFRWLKQHAEVRSHSREVDPTFFVLSQ